MHSLIRFYFVGVLSVVLVFAFTLEVGAKSAVFYVPKDQAEQALLRVLVQKGAILEVDQDIYRVELSGYHNGIAVPDSLAMDPVVSRLRLYDSSGRFKAHLVFEGKRSMSVPVQGRYYEVVEIPVLKRRIRNGTVVAVEDVIWKELPKYRLRSNMLTKLDQLVGMQPKHTLPADRPIQMSQLIEPYWVRKGHTIKMVYATSYIRLQMMGVALSDGKEGDVVRVRNEESGKVVSGVVVGENVVSVGVASRVNDNLRFAGHVQ